MPDDMKGAPEIAVPVELLRKVNLLRRVHQRSLKCIPKFDKPHEEKIGLAVFYSQPISLRLNI